ncbi:hypothetical protein BU24DRAFT_121490 [Aaosphaeria arxii CBS 175.79]|uniref:Uncharacterized protein n=1 Tax=Aaosphaeria arxii CBS 175.79 TaxID=1450172 RepID=A0A6A5Y2R4_9PLEO|nr:uncharacterized protein BU24DRAFT_121490 [Aaosphaeria arxii CBS 175.79]KAF2019523.1 hypothetical protein BU24DRAFT_121490 [Aaosphaeria arxii CBS 175.79]
MSHLDPAARRRAELPASIIFTPKELKHYRRWQLQSQSYFDTDSIGHLPSALEYSRFKTWREQQERMDMMMPDPFRWGDELAAHMSPPTATTSHNNTAPLSPPLSECEVDNIATVCGHALHPAIPTKEQAQCPTCIIKAHLQYFGLLTDKLASAGGPVCHKKSKDPRGIQQQTYEAWYCGKLDLVRTVYTIQTWAMQEESWQVADVDSDLKDRHSAHEALMTYWQTVDNATSDENSSSRPSEPEIEPEMTTLKRKDSGRERTVDFTQDTHFGEGRPQAYFRKDSPRYEPKIPTNDHDEDDEVAEDDYEEEDGEGSNIEISPEHAFSDEEEEDEDFSDGMSECTSDDGYSTCTEEGDWCGITFDAALDDEASYIIFE